MTSVEAVVLGVVQGVAEFLPISSSAHLLLLERWMRLPAGEGAMVFDLWLHVATLAALLTVYGRQVWAWGRGRLAGKKSGFPDRMAGWIALATVPAILFGVLAGDVVESARQPTVAASMLIGFGLLLWITDVLVARAGTRPLERFGVGRAVATGVAQALALIPGVSRSGIVITASRSLGLSRGQAVQWAFLLSVPITAAAAAHALIPAIASGAFTLTPTMMLGALTAWVTGIGAILLLRGLAERASFGWFALYRVALGILVLSVLS
jgi:undecaprenyl-diphosphatase